MESLTISQSHQSNSDVPQTSSRESESASSCYLEVVRSIMKYTSTLIALASSPSDQESILNGAARLDELEKAIIRCHRERSTANNDCDFIRETLLDIQKTVIAQYQSPQPRDMRPLLTDHSTTANTTVATVDSDDEALFASLRGDDGSHSMLYREGDTNSDSWSGGEESVTGYSRAPDDGREEGRSNKRLNRSATDFLTRWLVDHQDNPFPSQEEKHRLATQLHLSPQQVGNWMTNMRKRHLYPIISGKKAPKTPLDYTILERHYQQHPECVVGGLKSIEAVKRLTSQRPSPTTVAKPPQAQPRASRKCPRDSPSDSEYVDSEECDSDAEYRVQFLPCHAPDSKSDKNKRKSEATSQQIDLSSKKSKYIRSDQQDTGTVDDSGFVEDVPPLSSSYPSLWLGDHSTTETSIEDLMSGEELLKSAECEIGAVDRWFEDIDKKNSGIVMHGAYYTTVYAKACTSQCKLYRTI